MYGKKIVRLAAAVAAVFALALGACGNSAYAEEKNSVVIDGSTTVGPIAKAFAEYYMSKNEGVKITVNESGSSNGAKSLIGGTCDIASMSRFMKDKEFTAAVEKGISPVAHVVAMDGIAMVIHPSNPVKDLSVEQIRDIYIGKIKNWKEIGGTDQKIVMVSRDTSSGTYETFEGLVMSKQKIEESCEYVGSNVAVRNRITSTPGAIGYVGLGFLDNTVKAVTVNRIPATMRTVASGVYPIARPLYLFTNGYPKLGSVIHAFVTLHLSREGQKIVKEKGFVPVTEYKE